MQPARPGKSFLPNQVASDQSPPAPGRNRSMSLLVSIRPSSERLNVDLHVGKGSRRIVGYCPESAEDCPRSQAKSPEDYSLVFIVCDQRKTLTTLMPDRLSRPGMCGHARSSRSPRQRASRKSICPPFTLISNWKLRLPLGRQEGRSRRQSICLSRSD